MDTVDSPVPTVEARLRDVAAKVSDAELAVLDALERLGPLDETQIASGVRLSPSATTDALIHLEELGLVRAATDSPGQFVLVLT